MGKPEFIYVTWIETTPEKLWEALTSSPDAAQRNPGIAMRARRPRITLRSIRATTVIPE